MNVKHLFMWSLPGGVGEWGTISSWVGALLTGGALLLGFYVLLRDRRKEERAQAIRIAVAGSATQSGNDTLFTIHVRIWNNSNQVIFEPLLRIVGNADKVGLFDKKTNVLLAGEQAETTITKLNAHSTFGMRVVFRDNAGIEWTYDFYRRRLVKAHWRDKVGNINGVRAVTAVLRERLTLRAWLRRRNGTELVTFAVGDAPDGIALNRANSRTERDSRSSSD